MKKLFSTLLVFVLVVGLLAGCGNTDSSGDVTGEQKGSGEGNLKVAALLPGPVNDQGWNATAYNGLKLVEEKFGAEIAYTESVPVSDYEETFRNYAVAGYDIIIGHGFEFGDTAMKVAPEFPETKFIVTSTNISQEPNVASLNTDNFEQGFIQGVVAATLTETNTVGAVGGLEIPPIIDSLRGFEVGAKYINPDINVLTVFTGDFEDAAKAKEMAVALIEKGVDILMVDADQAGIGSIEAAADKGILAIGANGDQNALAPDTIVTSGVDDLAMALEILVQDILDGKFEAKYYDLGVAEGAVYLAPYYGFEDKLAQEDKDAIAQVIEDMKSGKLDAHSLDK